MLHTIRTIFETPLGLLLPPHGCRRAPGLPPGARRERRLRHARRRALWSSVHGAGVGAR